MDSPIAVAIVVFVGIFLLFFVVSLLADLLIVFIALGCAVLTYMVPEVYQAPYFQEFLGSLSFLESVGLSFPAEFDTGAHYQLAVLIAIAGTLACVPMLPFSATYRQMLGANKISGQDEKYIRHLMARELEKLRRHKSSPRHVEEPKTHEEEEEEDYEDYENEGFREKIKNMSLSKLSSIKERFAK